MPHKLDLLDYRVALEGDKLGDFTDVLTDIGARALNEHRRKVLEGEKVPVLDLITADVLTNERLTTTARKRTLNLLHKSNI